MLNETLRWSFRSKRPLTRWHEHVRLRPESAVGQWFRVDRCNGSVHWEHNLRPDEIVDISDGVLIANERRRLSVGSLRYGCFGICLETGKVLWSSPSSGLGEGIRRLAGWTDCPIFVADHRVYCRSGRVLDVATGRLLERVPRESVEPRSLPDSETVTLGRSKSLSDPVRLRIWEGRWLSHKLAVEADVNPTDEAFFKSVWDFRLFLTDDAGNIIWEFDLEELGYESCHCQYEEKCRYSFPHLYMLACEKRTTQMEGRTEVYCPSQFHLLTLDVTSGQIVQDVRVFDGPREQCRFEDMDEAGILVSDADRNLLYYERSPRRQTISTDH